MNNEVVTIETILQELENNENHTKEEIASYEKELNEIVLMLAKMK